MIEPSLGISSQGQGDLVSRSLSRVGCKIQVWGAGQRDLVSRALRRAGFRI